MAQPCRPEPGSNESNVAGGIRDARKEGGEASGEPEHHVWAGDRKMHRLPTIQSG